MLEPEAIQAGREAKILSLCNFLSKGWEVSILGLLAFLQQKYSLPLSLVGILSGVFIVVQISISFFAGRIAQRFHSRNVILMAVGASAIAWLTLFVAHGLPFLYIAYAFGGAASGLFEPIGNSLIAQRSTSSNRGTAIGNFAAFGDMGRIAVIAAATALAGLLGVNNACGVLFVSAVVALVLATRFIDNRQDSRDLEPDAPVRIADLVVNRNFMYATACGITDSFSSASLYIFIPFLLEAKGIALANTLYFNVIFFAGYMTGRLVLGRLADRHGAPRVLVLSELMMSVLIVILVLLHGNLAMLCLLYLLGVFTRGTSPIIRAMVADAMDDRASFHDAFSAYSFASRGATAACRPIYGYLAASAGIASVFYTAAVVAMGTIYPALRYRRFVPPAADSDSTGADRR